MLDFHPVQPWLAFADFSHIVSVWDWATEQVGAAPFQMDKVWERPVDDCTPSGLQMQGRAQHCA